jgi:hypothetical protein
MVLCERRQRQRIIGPAPFKPLPYRSRNAKMRVVSQNIHSFSAICTTSGMFYSKARDYRKLML